MSRLTLCLVLVVPLTGCMVEKKTTGGAVEKKVMSREEWKALIGKTKDEVRATIGKPDQTGHDGQEWYYLNRVMNPDTGKTDMGALTFRKDVVVEVRSG